MLGFFAFICTNGYNATLGHDMFLILQTVCTNGVRWYTDQMVFFALAIINVTEIATAHNSATGNADHTPFMPINIGKISIAAHSKTSVLATEITAEILPLLSAVKSPDAKMFVPHNR